MFEYPETFLARERALLGSRCETLLRHPDETPARGVTANTLRLTPERLLAQSGLPLRPSPFAPAAFRLADADLRPGRHPWHHAGAFYVQEPSAAAPAALLGVRPGMRVADLCAAPGGKSSQLAAALAGQGLLLANEYNAGRAAVLRQNLERMGVTNAVVTNEDTARLAAALPGLFDCVLVDAPCSGEGMFRKEAAAVSQYSQALVEHCAALGASILDNAASLVAPGGRLLLSTCTFAPEEDEGQVAAFLARHPEFLLCDLSGCGFGHPGEANRAPGAPAAFPAEKCRRIWPADGGEGHFMTLLQKQPDAAHDARPAKPWRTAKPPKEWRAFAAELFPALTDAPGRMVGDVWMLLPETPLPETRLHILRAGVPAGRVVKNRFEPAHALFMARGAFCPNREELTVADPRTAAWLRGEEIPARTAHNGWCAVLVDGMPLGCGKASGGRIKNHYPKALRIQGESLEPYAQT